jgi:hypothetical protein
MTTDDADKAKMLDRIRKLLAKAEDPAATTGEAETYTAKATELIAKYGIDQALLAASGVTRSTIGNRIVTVDSPYSYAKALLLYRLVEALGGEAIMMTNRRGTATGGVRKVHIFGYDSDLERAELLYTSLLVQLSFAMLAGIPEPGEGIKEWRRSFIIGFTERVVARVREAEEAAHRQADRERTSGPSTDLVLVDRAKLVRREFMQVYPSVRTTSMSAGTSGMDAGRAAGNRASLGGTRVGSGAGRPALGR